MSARCRHLACLKHVESLWPRDIAWRSGSLWLPDIAQLRCEDRSLCSPTMRIMAVVFIVTQTPSLFRPTHQ